MSAPDLDSTLSSLAEEARNVTGARYAAIGVFTATGALQRFLTVGMDAATEAGIDHPPEGKGLLGVLPSQPEPLRVHDLASDPRSVGFPSGHPPMTTFLGVPIRSNERVFGHLYLTDKHATDGTGPLPFTVGDEETAQALAAAAATALENVRAYDAAREGQRWQQAVTDIANAGLAGADAGEVLQLVARSAQQLSGADVAALALPENSGLLQVEVAETDPQVHAQIASVARSWLGLQLPENSILHASFDSGETMFAPDLARDPVLHLERDSDAPGPILSGMAAVIPLRASNRRLGVLALVWDHASEGFTEASLDVASSFAAQAALTLVLAEAGHDRAERGLLQERERIARDMHDLVVQRVFATGMLLQRVQRTAELDATTHEHIDRAIDELNETIREIRETIFHLQQPPQPAGLTEVISREAAQAALALGFQPGLRVVGPLPTLHPDTRATQTSLTDDSVAVVREALSNVARHSQATRADVLLEVSRGWFTIRVDDDGRGIPDVRTHRSGLRNLHQRAISRGGQCRLTAHPSGSGARLVWRVPLDSGERPISMGPPSPPGEGAH